ncbi:MAG: DivIVA domain-containing protein [Clostridia bacterium]
MVKRKSKYEPRFPMAHRGYDVNAVEAFLSVQQTRAEEVAMAQKERISALKSQNADLNAELLALKTREEQIKSTLISATEKADKMTLDIKLRYAMELDRLKLFRAKWTNAYEEIKERYHFSKDALNMESVVVSTEMEIQKFLAQDFSLPKGDNVSEMEVYFKGEADRLTEADSNVQELKRKLIEANERKLAEKQQQLDNNFRQQAENCFKQQPNLQPQKAESSFKQQQTAQAQKTENCNKPNTQSEDIVYANISKKENVSKQTKEAAKANAVAFSLEDALNPKESLAEICQYLGLPK